MVTKTKKQVDEVNSLLKEKLEEMKELEQKVTATAADLVVPALGVHRDVNGGFHLVQLKYDVETGASAIDTVTDLHTKDYAIALFKSKEYLVMNILKEYRK